ncbi:MAG: VOC family protein [Myxococcales bacterium]
MQARLSVVTLGVSDLARARDFYCNGLGFQASSAGNEHVVFIQAGAVVLALWSREELAKDAHLPASPPAPFSGVSLAQNYGSKAEVDAALQVAERAGAKILKPAQEVFWGGYSGYFADPDGHLWEVAFNPFWPLDARGNVTLP